jgi:hypothetical protein
MNTVHASQNQILISFVSNSKSRCHYQRNFTHNIGLDRAGFFISGYSSWLCDVPCHPFRPIRKNALILWYERRLKQLYALPAHFPLDSFNQAATQGRPLQHPHSCPKETTSSYRLESREHAAMPSMPWPPCTASEAPISVMNM